MLADGARWIWDRAETAFPGSTGMLDIYHGSEHIAATAKTLYGEGSSLAAQWTDAGRKAWRVRRVNRMATLCSAFDSDHWDAYWNSIQN